MPAPSALTPEQTRLRASLAAHESWARTTDRPARTAKAREARWARYLAKARELHADHEVTDEFITEVAEHLRLADMRRMALASARARQRKTADRMRAAHEARDVET
jgi:hypothetical protein